MPMIVQTRYAAVLAFAALTLTLTMPHAGRAAEPTRVGVSVPAAIAFVPLQVGIEQGIFKKQGLDVERSDLGGAARAQQALAAGSLDLVAAGGPDLALVAKGRHALAVGVITLGPRQTTLIVRNDNPMTLHAELKGKRVGISTAGGLSDWVVRQLSRRLGFGPHGITSVALGADSAQVAALRTGQIDATVMDLASGLRLEELGTGRVFLRVRDYVPVMIAQAIYAGNDVRAKRPAAVRSFLAGWYETIAFMRGNKALTLPIAARRMDVSLPVASRLYDELIDNYSTDGRFDPEGAEGSGRLAHRNGRARQPRRQRPLYGGVLSGEVRQILHMTIPFDKLKARLLANPKGQSRLIWAARLFDVFPDFPVTRPEFKALARFAIHRIFGN